MTKLEAKSADVGVEKHLPSVVKEGNVLNVTVGETVHPMTDEHYIQWIAVVQDNRTERVSLSSADEPKGTFTVDGSADVYAYCNIHGLWKVTVN